ncbi:MAG: FKBP-type peptidyl-prolyl cis-trans isomerase [Marinoscillum sp.]
MTKYRIQLLAVLVVIIFLASACEDDGITTVVTTEDQLALDIVKINDYIAKKGYANVDTTSRGVRYVVTNEGNGDTIESGDIVSLHYTGRFTDDVLFDTSIDTVAINNDVYDSTRTYKPIFIFTQSESGWALVSAYPNVRPGFSNGVTEALKKIKVGGSARLIIPSTLGYGASSYQGIPPNTILIFDVYPVKVRKD